MLHSALFPFNSLHFRNDLLRPWVLNELGTTDKVDFFVEGLLLAHCYYECLCLCGHTSICYTLLQIIAFNLACLNSGDIFHRELVADKVRHKYFHSGKLLKGQFWLIHKLFAGESSALFYPVADR